MKLNILKFPIPSKGDLQKILTQGHLFKAEIQLLRVNNNYNKSVIYLLYVINKKVYTRYNTDEKIH